MTTEHLEQWRRTRSSNPVAFRKLVRESGAGASTSKAPTEDYASPKEPDAYELTDWEKEFEDAGEPCEKSLSQGAGPSMGRAEVPAAEAIEPPRLVDLWLSRSEDQIGAVLQALMECDGRTWQRSWSPVWGPLGLMRGPARSCFLWRNGDAGLEKTAAATNRSVQEILLSKQSEDVAITLVQTTHTYMPEGRLALFFPPFRALDVEFFSHGPLNELCIRSVVWLETNHGAIGAGDVRGFLRHALKDYPLQVVMPNLLAGAKQAMSDTASDPVRGTAAQLNAFYSADFRAWLHTSP